MEDHPPADETPPVDRYIGIEDGVLGNDRIMPDVNPRIEDDAPFDPGASADIHTRVDGHIPGNSGTFLNDGKSADPGEPVILGMEKGQCPAEGDVRVIYDEQVLPRRFHSGRHQDCRSGSRLYFFQIFRIGDKSQVPFFRFFYSPDPADDHGAVSDDLAFQEDRKFMQCLLHGSFSSLALL